MVEALAERDKMKNFKSFLEDKTLKDIVKREKESITSPRSLNPPKNKLQNAVLGDEGQRLRTPIGLRSDASVGGSVYPTARGNAPPGPVELRCKRPAELQRGKSGNLNWPRIVTRTRKANDGNRSTLLSPTPRPSQCTTADGWSRR